MKSNRVYDKIIHEAVGTEAAKGGVFQGLEAGDIIRLIDIYQLADKLYSYLSRSVDKAKSEKAADWFDDFLNSVSEICMPIEIGMNDLEESGNWPNSQIMNKWNNVHNFR